MSLCNVCINVPFLSLPKPVDSSVFTHVGDNEEMLEVHGPSEDGSFETGRLPDVVGVPFHENIEALATSAGSCPLCLIVQAGVQMWINGWQHVAENKPSFNEFQRERSPLPTNQPLVLTQCVSGPLGFLVWARNPSSDKILYLLTAVGFSVQACESLYLLCCQTTGECV